MERAIKKFRFSTLFLLDFDFSARALDSKLGLILSPAAEAVHEEAVVAVVAVVAVAVAAAVAGALTGAGVEGAALDGDVTKLRPTGTRGLAGSSIHLMILIFSDVN